MCGICGIWNRDGSPVDLETLRQAATAIRHRGPDDEGYLLVNTAEGRVVLCAGENSAPELALPALNSFAGQHFDLAFGFRRLAILDLSPAGHQPMSSHDGRYWIVFNGEVYNYIELRRELASKGYRFNTGCDTEVILAAYAEWGADCLRRFNGMWGMAIWDNKERRLFVARDRLGVKPFYIADGVGRRFAFGSEIKALIASGLVPFRPSRMAVAQFVARNGFLSHQEGSTFFEGVRSLPAANYALITAGTSRQRQYWSLAPDSVGRGESRAKVVEQYRDLFTDSVRLRLRADVPVGTCLSGGLDSSSIVAVAGQLMQREHAVSLERLGSHQQTFSAVYDTDGPWNERAHMERVVARTHAAANYIFPSADRLWRDLESLVWHQDEPFPTTSIFAQWCVMSLAHERGVTVLLDGQGADEVLAGYRPYAVWLGELLRRGRLLQAAREAGEIKSVTGLDPLKLIGRGVVQQLPAPFLRKVRGRRVDAALGRSCLQPDLAAEFGASPLAMGNAYADLSNMNAHLARQLEEDSLPNLLRYEDRNSMAFSIESRVPFLDYRLVEYVFAHATDLRIHRGWTKWIHRAAVMQSLPREVVWRRDKVGFETPEKQWFRDGRDHLMDLLGSAGAASDYLDMPAVRREAPGLIERGETGQVWRWVNLALWLRCFSSLQSDVPGATEARLPV